MHFLLFNFFLFLWFFFFFFLLFFISFDYFFSQYIPSMARPPRRHRRARRELDSDVPFPSPQRPTQLSPHIDSDEPSAPQRPTQSSLSPFNSGSAGVMGTALPVLPHGTPELQVCANCNFLCFLFIPFFWIWWKRIKTKLWVSLVYVNFLRCPNGNTDVHYVFNQYAENAYQNQREG